MEIQRKDNGNVVIIMGVNETVTILGASIHVSLAPAENMSMRPKLATDVDSVIVTGRRRAAADYPPGVTPDATPDATPDVNIDDH